MLGTNVAEIRWPGERAGGMGQAAPVGTMQERGWAESLLEFLSQACEGHLPGERGGVAMATLMLMPVDTPSPCISTARESSRKGCPFPSFRDPPTPHFQVETWSRA